MNTQQHFKLLLRQRFAVKKTLVGVATHAGEAVALPADAAGT